MTNGDSVVCLPEWLANKYTDLCKRLSHNAENSLREFMKGFPTINELTSQLPKTTTLYELYQIVPDKLQQIFPDPFSALAHACEALIGFWSFQHAYKFKASFDGFTYSLTEGNFLLAFSCTRSMFEEMAHFHLFLERIEGSYKKARQLVEQEAPGLRKGRRPTEDWIKKYMSCQLEIINQVKKAVEGSDYNWSGWDAHILGELGVTGVDINAQVQAHSQPRKTHINDCLRSLEEKSQLKSNEVYALLSEMVHPNFGSNTLVVVTRNKMSDLYGEAILASNPKNVEAAAWFFELAAAPLSNIFRLEASYIARGQVLLKFFQNMASSTALTRSGGQGEPLRRR